MFDCNTFFSLHFFSVSGLKLIGRMFAGDAVLLVYVEHVLAGTGSVSADPGRAPVPQDPAAR